jgi:hypothetical protein
MLSLLYKASAVFFPSFQRLHRSGPNSFRKAYSRSQITESNHTMNSKDATRFDAALGAFLGACVGDAAGAVLEFLGCPPTKEQVGRDCCNSLSSIQQMLEAKRENASLRSQVDDALRMPGGGVWRVGPGQVTEPLQHTYAANKYTISCLENSQDSTTCSEIMLQGRHDTYAMMGAAELLLLPGLRPPACS